MTQSTRNPAADVCHILGTILMCGGGAGLFIMSVIGSISIDLVILSYASKRRDGFMTGFILGSMFSRGSIWPFFGCSLATTGVAVILSIALGVPGIGALLLAGWAAAILTFSLGATLYNIGDKLETPEPTQANRFAFV
jgi:hypothetical protein